MKRSKKATKGKKDEKPMASAALRHPLRVRILEVVNEQDMSPNQFMLRQLAPEVEVSAKSLSSISYHFRELAKMGCIEIARTYARRG
ncbi:MAG TPA: hypothetical protein VN733_07830, partial [Solirubrobacterales bacterium]|nr:hypothetical protein [Solirubrobacterales bacterium]